jgi:Cu(I)/Ag(I) efflux system protein CusF
MKPSIAILIPLLFTLHPASSMAASEHNAHSAHGSGATQQKRTNANEALADGVVKKIDKAAAKVTITHGPLKSLGMPGMTMVFRVKDAVWLDQMQTGEKIRFQAETISGVLTVVRYETVN